MKINQIVNRVKNLPFVLFLAITSVLITSCGNDSDPMDKLYDEINRAADATYKDIGFVESQAVKDLMRACRNNNYKACDQLNAHYRKGDLFIEQGIVYYKNKRLDLSQ